MNKEDNFWGSDDIYLLLHKLNIFLSTQKFAFNFKQFSDLRKAGIILV